jgi:PTH1 family peptidyl-tRNA hydrolase
MALFWKSSTQNTVNLKLVVGLGNIGSQYVSTRHNVGFDVVDELAREHQARFKKGKFKGDDTQINIAGHKILLLKPATFMNLSGESVIAAVRFYRIPPTEILIICDDVALPVGKIRFRAKGSDGGHNGLYNIINRLGTNAFARLRIGVGAPPPQMDMVDYVLGRFLSDERDKIAEARDNAVRGVETWIKEGITPAMNRWNAASNDKPKQNIVENDNDTE